MCASPTCTYFSEFQGHISMEGFGMVNIKAETYRMCIVS